LSPSTLHVWQRRPGLIRDTPLFDQRSLVQHAVAKSAPRATALIVFLVNDDQFVEVRAKRIVPLPSENSGELVNRPSGAAN